MKNIESSFWKLKNAHFLDLHQHKWKKIWAMLWNEKLKLNICKKCSIFRLASPKNGHPCGVKGMESILGKFLNVQFLNLH